MSQSDLAVAADRVERAASRFHAAFHAAHRANFRTAAFASLAYARVERIRGELMSLGHEYDRLAERAGLPENDRYPWQTHLRQ